MSTKPPPRVSPYRSAQLAMDATRVRILGYNLYCLSMHNTPAAALAFKWMSDPQPGDLVIETSTAHYRDRDADAVGRLVRKAREPNTNHMLETVWYVERLDGTTERWRNADFIRLPETLAPWEEAKL